MAWNQDLRVGPLYPERILADHRNALGRASPVPRAQTGALDVTHAPNTLGEPHSGRVPQRKGRV